MEIESDKYNEEEKSSRALRRFIKQRQGVMENLITIRGLCFSHGDRLVFDGVDLDIPRGKITAIMGPSGTGKTTLLRLIGGELTPDKGEIWVDGKNVPDMTYAELYEMRRHMGLLFQTGALFTDLDVYENVAFPMRTHTNLPESMIRDLVMMKLEAVGLRGAQDLMPHALSGGMARRVALARAIALDPAFIMYDEPFTGQDPISMAVLIKLVRLMNQSLHTTSILVSHDVPETASIADYIYVLAHGKVVGEGAPKQLLKSEEPRVKQFMQGLPDGPVRFHYPADDFVETLLRRVDR